MITRPPGTDPETVTEIGSPKRPCCGVTLIAANPEAEPIPNSTKRNKAWAIELLAFRSMRRNFKVIVLFVISASRRALYIDNQKRNFFRVYQKRDSFS